jgi:hypothetical protein
MCKKTRKQVLDRASEATSLLPIWDLETWFVLLFLSFASPLAVWESLSLFHPVCYLLVRSLCLSLSLSLSLWTWNLFCAPSAKSLLFIKTISSGN